MILKVVIFESAQGVKRNISPKPDCLGVGI